MTELEQLQKYALCFEKFIEWKMTDRDGMVISMMDLETLERVTENTFRGGIPAGWGDWCVPGFNRPEFAEYENTGMVTGAYLLSLVCEYENDADPELLKKIRLYADGILKVADIGRTLEWGYFPKNYGGRYSPQTSTDQYLSVMSALDAAYSYLTPETQKKAADFIVAAVEFWRKREYKYTYFIYKDMKWPDLRFPSFLYLAAKYSGDARYTKEADELTEKNLAFIPENSKLRERDLSETEKKYGVRMVWSYPDSCSMDTLNADLILRSAPGSRFEETWRKSLLTIWNEGKMVLSDNGECYATMAIDLKTGKYLPGDPKLDPGWISFRTAWSTMIIRAGLLAAVWNPGQRAEILKKAKEVLLHFTDIRQFNYQDPADAEQLPPDKRFKTRFLSGDAVTNYLWSVRLLEKLEKEA